MLSLEEQLSLKIHYQKNSYLKQKRMNSPTDSFSWQSVTAIPRWIYFKDQYKFGLSVYAYNMPTAVLPDWAHL